MMLKETIRYRNKTVQLVIFTLLLCGTLSILILWWIQDKNLVDQKEFQAIEGDWKVVEYLGKAVEYHEIENNSEDGERKNEEEYNEIEKKFLYKELSINRKSVMLFSSPSELGYYYSDWTELFLLYRQPPNNLDLVPRFLCTSFQLNGYEESLDIIMDSNGDAILEVNGRFFRLEKISKEEV